MNRDYQAAFEDEFSLQYSQSHVIDTHKLRCIAKLFAHVLQTDSLPWEVLKNIRLTEKDTTSGSRVFIKFLFQDLAELMGLAKVWLVHSSMTLAHHRLTPHSCACG